MSEDDSIVPSETSLLLQETSSSSSSSKIVSAPYVDHSRYAVVVIILNAASNFSLYGVQTIYQTYFEDGIGLEPRIAGVMSAVATQMVYFFALVGGMVADSYLGLFKTIIVGSILTLMGLVSLLLANIFTEVLKVVSYVGLGLFVIGSGLAKSCTSAFLGEQFDDDQMEKRGVYYSWYYMSIQFGSIAVSIGAPTLYSLRPMGAYTLFAVLSASLILIVPLFAAFWRKFRRRKPGGSVYTLFLKILAAGCCKSRRQPSQGNVQVDPLAPRPHWLDKAKQRFDSDDVEDVKQSLNVLLVFAPLIVFWTLFFSLYTTWVRQASKMDRCISYALNATSPGSCLKIAPGATTTLNPVFDLILIPLTAKLIYPAMKRAGYELTPLRKICIGLMFTILACVVAGVLSFFIHRAGDGVISVWYMVPQYFLLSCGEISCAVTAYSFAYSEAPDTMKGLMTGSLMATISIGNMLLALMQLIKTELAIQNFILAGLLALVLLIFVILTRTYRYAEKRD